MHRKFFYITLILVLSLLTFVFSIHSSNADLADQDSISDLNYTRPSLSELEGFSPIGSDYSYGILPRSLRDLVVNAMTCGWVSVIISCSALYLVSGCFVWSRKKTAIVVLLTVLGAITLTFVSWFYQVEPYTLDAKFVYYGYPFVWFKFSTSPFWASLLGTPLETYKLQWYGLIGNIVFYAWIIFGALISYMGIQKRLRLKFK